MLRLLVRSLALAGLSLAGATLSVARAETLAPEHAPVRLAAPVHGATLEAGSLAVLAWEPLGPFASLTQVEEWEAFLSLDGGAHYPIRITPHLDHQLRRVLWQVPHIPTRNARLLLRFGDEHRETGVELPVRFAISGTLSPLTEAVSRATVPGEPARPGDAGVVAWVEGSRQGGDLREVIAADTASLAAGSTVAPDAAWRAVANAEDAFPDAPPLASGKSTRLGEIPSPRKSAADGARRPAPIPILLLIQRQNE